MVSTTTAVRCASSGIAGRLGRARHVEVEHEHVGPVRGDHPPRGVDLAGLGDDRQALLGVEQHAQARPHDRVVVGEDEPDLTLTHGPRRYRPG